MQFINNEPKQIEIRKSQNTLIVVGSGIILFGVWSAVKMLSMLFLLRKETVEGILSITGPVEELPEAVIFWVVVGIIIIIMAVILGIRLYMGMSAIAEGRGKRRSPLYILIALFIIISDIVFLITAFFTAEASQQLGALTRNQSISTMIIDATSMIMLIEMVISALKVRKLKRKKHKTKG